MIKMSFLQDDNDGYDTGHIDGKVEGKKEGEIEGYNEALDDVLSDMKGMISEKDYEHMEWVTTRLRKKE